MKINAAAKNATIVMTAVPVKDAIGGNFGKTGAVYTAVNAINAVIKISKTAL